MALDLEGLNTEGLVYDDKDATHPLRSTMEQSVKTNPEQSAKIFDISQRAGVSSEVVRSKPEDFEQSEQLKDLNLDGLVLSSPGTAKYLEDMDNASVSHDDVPVLKKLESAVKKAYGFTIPGAVNNVSKGINEVYDEGKLVEGYGTTLKNRLAGYFDGLYMSFLEGQDARAKKQLEAIKRQKGRVGSVFGEEFAAEHEQATIKNIGEARDAYTDQYIELQQQFIKRAEETMAATPEDLTVLQEGIRSGGVSLMDMGFALTFAGLTRTGKAGVLGFMGTTVYSDSYANARSKGLDHNDAHVYSLLQGGVEVGTELLPVKTLTAMMQVPGSDKMLRNVVKFMAQEGATEQLATIGNTIVDYGYELDEELANAKTPEEILDIQLERQAVTAIATVVGGGGQIAIAQGVNQIGQQLMTEEQRNAMRQAHEQAALDEIAASAQESKTKQRSPAMMKRFMQAANESSSNEVYIDAVQARLYLSELTEEEIQADPGLTMLAEKISNNEAPNGDVTIPLGDFAADIVGNEHYEALRPHMKLSNETDTPFRQESEGQQRVDYVKNLMQQAEQNASAYVENREMFESVKQQLIDTEVVSPKLADYYAQLIPAYVTVKSDELGLPPLEVYKQLGLNIEGPYTERKAALAEGRVLEQDLIVPPEGFDKFVDLASKAETVDELYKGIQSIKDVPIEVAEWFRKTYDPEEILTPKQASKAFLEDVKNGKYSNNQFNQEVEQTDTPKFKAWAGTEDPVIEGFDINETDFRQVKPRVLRVFHGTTHDVQEFDASVKGNKEGQFGAINYFTSSEYDAEQNYLSSGPDITSRIEQRAEKLADEISDFYEENGGTDNDAEAVEAVKAEYGEEYYDEDHMQMAKNIVAKELTGDNEQVMELFVRVNNPFVVGGDTNSFVVNIDFEGAEQYAIQEVAEENDISEDEVRENYEEYEEEIYNHKDDFFADNEGELIEAIDTVARRNGLDTSELLRGLEDLLSEESFDHTSLEGLLRNAEGIAYAEDNETGDLIGSHIIAQIIQELGYDSIILKDANQRFENMDMEQGTAHIHVFDENNVQIKSATGNNGQFDPNDPNIFRQDGFFADDTRATNFSKWFGNSAVVDEQGQPKVVYHGTPAEFEVFDKSKAGDNTQADNADLGFFFTDNASIAAVYPKMNGATTSNVMPVYLSMQNPLTLNVADMTEADQLITKHFTDQFDGAIVNVVGSNQTVYMVRDNMQIKSVDNNGQFDPNNPNIYRQSGIDMSKEARMKRAEQQGFDTSTVLYHGTNQDIEAFNTSGGDGKTFGTGLFLSDNEAVANTYATGDGQNVMPVYAKLESPMVIDAAGNNWSRLALDIEVTLPSIQKSNKEDIDLLTALEQDTSNISDVTTTEGKVTTLGEALEVDRLYDDFVSTDDVARWARRQGYDGVIIKNVRDIGPNGRHVTEKSGELSTNYVVFNPENLRSVNAAFIDERSAQILSQTQTRGYYDVSNVTIRLSEASDASTFLHEFAHFMLDMERKTNGRQMVNIQGWWGRNSKNIAEEASLEEEVVNRWLEDSTSVTKEEADAIDRATHEQFARGFETYIMEGKAPSVELRNAFRVFARLIKQVYEAITGGLNKPNLDAEMRQVFDRLLATEEQIVAEEARARYEPLFTDAAMAGMTEEDYQAYLERSESARDKSRETLRDKLLKELKRSTKKWWQTELADRTEDKIVELSNTRVYAAAEKIKSDDAFKIDRLAAKELLGVDKVPPQLRGMTVTGKQGALPDDVAATLGYGSGMEMLTELVEMKPIKQAAEELALAEMLEVHGDIMNDGTLEQMAQDAARNEERAELIIEEIKHLSRSNGVPEIDKQTLQQLADIEIGKRSLTQIRPDRYRRAEIRSAQAAAVAMQEGNTEEALRAKTQQVMNMYLWRSAMAAREQGERVTKYMARFRKKNVRERIGKAGNGYLDNILSILDRFEFRKSISIRQARANAQSIQAWLTGRMEDGDNIVLSGEVLDERYGMHWKEIPIDELTGVYESVLSIEHNAKAANEIVLAEETLSFEQAVNRALASMAKVENKFSAQRTDIIDERNPVRRFIAEQTKIPFLTTWLDGGERVGTMTELIMTPINNAHYNEQQLWATTGKRVVELLTERSAEMRKRHSTKLFIPELVSEPTDMHTGHDGHLYGHQVLAVALNTGNQSNLKKMLVGEGWATEENYDIDNPQLQAVLQHMTKEDWDLVQSLWNEIDTLYPLLAEVHERTSGLPLERVEATPVETPYGTYQGGYYPAKYDPNRSQRAAENEAKANEQTLSMFNGAGLLIPSTSTGARIERTDYVGPIKLSLDVVQEHMHEVIHFVTHYEAVKQVYKVIKNPQIAEAITAKMGKSEYALLKPWLNDVAKDGRAAEPKLQMESWLGRLRLGVTLGVMGFKASTVLIQGSGIFNTMAETGPTNVFRAIRSIMASEKTMKESYDYAFENSKVLKFRMQTMDREMRNVVSKLEGKTGLLTKVQEVSMMGIALRQTYTVDIASWYAGYLKGMKDFDGDQQRAFKYADWVVENAQGSGATKDMVAIMRNKNEAWRLLTMFMTFFSSLGNMIRDTTRGARSGRYSIGSVGAKAMFMFLLPGIYEALMREGIPDDDDDLEGFVEKVVFNTSMMPLGTLPVVRDVANGVGSGFGYNASPVYATIGKGVESSAAMVQNIADDDEVTRSQIKNFSKLMAAWYGVPGVNQAWATGEHIEEVLSDGEDFSTREFLFGPDRD